MIAFLCSANPIAANLLALETTSGRTQPPKSNQMPSIHLPFSQTNKFAKICKAYRSSVYDGN